MQLLIFTEGTILMHAAGQHTSRLERVRQSQAATADIYDYTQYIPIGDAATKIQRWVDQGAKVAYLTSRRITEPVKTIQRILDHYHFPAGELYFRHNGESYADAALRAKPDILIEDDCESSGGEAEMTYSQLSAAAKPQIKLIMIPEFGGIDHLPDRLDQL